ncbi:hypothetical protein [Methanorbis furvi]|uniref:Uncharacterized protein n=1 Tax=Methanorbis furvi TaxID=3028299 RepID=A0AAE4ME58_9EURY|nr:hypothetical protein [Methanocorpusculaceae archaeon Ag1]
MTYHGSELEVKTDHKVVSLMLRSINMRKPEQLRQIWSTIQKGLTIMIHDEIEKCGVPVSTLDGGELSLVIKFREFTPEEARLVEGREDDRHCVKCDNSCMKQRMRKDDTEELS